jgi:crossover junction endodeoxyribonuclease RusA
MGDRYLPSSTACSTNCSNPCGSGPSGGADVGERIVCTSTPSNHDALQSVCQIVLPWPPSVNGYFASVRGRLILAAKGRAYREAVKWMAVEQKWPNFNHSRIRIEFEAWMPDKRRRDLDNLLKSLCDSLTHAGLWHDDSQIDDLRIYRAPLVGGMIKARISALEAA